MRKITDRTGEEVINKHGNVVKIIKYRNAYDIDVQFDDGYVAIHKTYRVFKRGGLASPYFKNVVNVGCFGVGEYNTITHRPYYIIWNNMIKRCYNEKIIKENPTYRDCYICEEWLNFQNFAKWYEENKWEADGRMEIDKDILVKGNKLYSPETCVISEKFINTLFTKSNKTRGEYMIGVSKYKEKYLARCNNNNKAIRLGLFDNELDAFEAYKKSKESYIKQVADEYKEKYPDFPQKLYDAMYRYEVEITD